MFYFYLCSTCAFVFPDIIKRWDWFTVEIKFSIDSLWIQTFVIKTSLHTSPHCVLYYSGFLFFNNYYLFGYMINQESHQKSGNFQIAFLLMRLLILIGPLCLLLPGLLLSGLLLPAVWVIKYTFVKYVLCVWFDLRSTNNNRL